MIHARQSARSGVTAQAPTGVWAVLGLLAVAFALAGCGDGRGIDPEELLFGQLGQIEIRLEVPLKLGDGQLLQELYWDSKGTWLRKEAISYRGILGEASTFTSTGDPSQIGRAHV